jgi:hypothetical protein
MPILYQRLCIAKGVLHRVIPFFMLVFLVASGIRGTSSWPLKEVFDVPAAPC